MNRGSINRAPITRAPINLARIHRASINGAPINRALLIGVLWLSPLASYSRSCVSMAIRGRVHGTCDFVPNHNRGDAQVCDVGEENSYKASQK